MARDQKKATGSSPDVQALAVRPASSNLVTSIANKNFGDYTRATIGKNSNGECAAYLEGAARSDEVCIFINVALDVSRSMQIKMPGSQKTRLEVVLDCLNDVITSPSLKLNFPDSLVIHTFCNDFDFGASCAPNKYDHQRLVRDITATLDKKKGTHLRDAMAKALDSMEKYPHKQKRGKEVKRYLLVFTDGEDMGSSHSLDDVRLRLEAAARRLQNLHVVVIAVGLRSEAVEDLKKLGESRSVPFMVIEAERFEEKRLKTAFDSAMDQLRMLLFLDKNGSLHQKGYRGRDKEKVEQLDRGAQAVLKTCEKVQQLTLTERSAHTLMAMM